MGEPVTVAHAQEIATRLVEADVYATYGLRDQAIEQLRCVLALDTHNRDARQRLAALAREPEFADLVVDAWPTGSGRLGSNVPANELEAAEPEVQELDLSVTPPIDAADPGAESDADPTALVAAVPLALLEGSVEAGLEIVDELVGSDRLVEAMAVLDELRARHADNPLLLSKQGELDWLTIGV